MLGMAGGRLLYSCMRDLQQQEAGGDAADLQYLLKGVQQLAHALVLYEQVQNLGGVDKELLVMVALSILEHSDWEERGRFRTGVLTQLGASIEQQQQRGAVGGGREGLVGLCYQPQHKQPVGNPQQEQQQQDERLSPAHRQQQQQQQQQYGTGSFALQEQEEGMEMQEVAGGAGTYQQQQKLENVVGVQQQQQAGLGGQEMELQETASERNSWTAV